MWVSDNAYIDFPILANDIFLFGAVAKISNNYFPANFFADSGNSIANNIFALVFKFTNKF